MFLLYILVKLADVKDFNYSFSSRCLVYLFVLSLLGIWLLHHGNRHSTKYRSFSLVYLTGFFSFTYAMRFEKTIYQSNRLLFHFKSQVKKQAHKECAINIKVFGVGAEKPMFDKIRIIVGIDGSLQSKKALVEAITIAKSFSGFTKAICIFEKGGKEKAENIISEAERDLAKAEVSFDTAAVQGSNPAKTLATIAKQENFDLIVVGSRGIGGRVSALLGSVSKQVVGNAYCNVLVVKK